MKARIINNVMRRASKFTAQVKRGDFEFSPKQINYRGNEIQKFQVGEQVSSTNLSPYVFENETITEVYEQCGHYYYIIKNLNFTARLRDIKK